MINFEFKYLHFEKKSNEFAAKSKHYILNLSSSKRLQNFSCTYGLNESNQVLETSIVRDLYLKKQQIEKWLNHTNEDQQNIAMICQFRGFSVA